MMKELVLLVIIVTAGQVDANSSGAPQSTCSNLLPNTNSHGQPSSAQSPYALSFDGDTYMPGTLKTVTITSNDPLRGVLCQVRKTDNSQTPIGTFQVEGSDAKFKTLECNNDPNSAVTHKNANDVTGASFMWMPPDDDMGDLKVYCSIVKSNSGGVQVYWTGLESDEISYMEDSTESQEMTTESKACSTIFTSVLTELMLLIPLWAITAFVLRY